MRLLPEINDALNSQVVSEYRNSLIYKQIESHFETLQLKNIAKHFRDQSRHETDHANKFIDYMNSRTGGSVSIGDIDVPSSVTFDLHQIADLYVQLEEETTVSIEEIYELALDNKSFMDLGFLGSMLNEQVEEEDEANKFALNLKMVKDIVLFDKSLGE